MQSDGGESEKEMNKTQFFTAAKFFGISHEDAQAYLDAARGYPELAYLAMLEYGDNDKRVKNYSYERKITMPNEYGKDTDAEKHEKMLAASAEFVAQVKRYMRQHRIPDREYEAATREYREMLADNGDGLVDVMTFGEVDIPDDERVFTWQEADDLLVKMTKARMEKTGESYLEARRSVEQDPVNAEVLRSYVQS